MNRPIKVLHIIETLCPGGAEKVTLDMTCILKHHDVNVDILTIIDKGVWADRVCNGIKVHALNRSSKFNPLYYFQLARHLNNYDIAHVHMRHTLKYVFIALFASVKKKPIVFHEHGEIDLFKRSSFIYRLMFRRVWLIANTSRLYRQCKKLGIRRVYYLPNVIRAQPRQSTGLGGDEKCKRMVVVSNFWPNKNIHLAISTIEQLIRSGANVKLDIYGNPSNAGYYNSCVSLIQSKGLEDIVKIISGNDNITSVLPGYDLALHPSLSETGPLVLLEYLSNDLPFLTYHTGEVVSLIYSVLPEFVSDTLSVEDWQEKIGILLAKDRKFFQSRSRLVYEKYFSQDKYAKNVIQIYKECLAS